MNFFVRKIKWFIQRSIIRFFSCFCKMEPKIFFSSFDGKQYSDNPRAISEKMHSLYPNFRLVWALNDTNNSYQLIPDYIKTVKTGTWAYYKEFATAACFVTNEGVNPSVSKRKGQYFILTWHGDRGFKRIIYDSNRAKERRVSDISYKLADLFIAGSLYGEQRCRDSFRYNGEILCDGMPRNDNLVNLPAAKITKTKECLSINPDAKVLLYAPTYRDGEKTQKVNVDLDGFIKCLQEKGESWVCLGRTHSMTEGFTTDRSAHFMDVTCYPDMADLLLIADILITDYSSSSGDFIIKDKPVILAIFDVDEYQSQSRELRFNPEEAGYICVHNNKELLELGEQLTQNMGIEECRILKEFYEINETGKSSEIICKRIAEHMKKTEI